LYESLSSLSLSSVGSISAPEVTPR
jgi:hypothetical protein